ncbi:MAG: sugar phosphate nucleotidyltransferase [Catalinimonas sp.]
MKVVIPVAGLGSRMRPHTHTQPKALLPVAGKAILAHIVDNLRTYGLRDFVFVVGYLSEKIDAFLAERYPNGELRRRMVLQEPRLGIAHALLSARAEIEGESEVLVVLGDTIVQFDLEAMRRTPGTVLGVRRVERPGQFGVADLDEAGRVRRLVEKPRIPKSNLALVGVYKIHRPAALLDTIEEMIAEDARTQGQFHLTDALMRRVGAGEVMTTQTVDNWFDCGRKQTLLDANATLLDRRPPEALPTFPDTVLIPPVSIGEGCDIRASVIGPHVAVADHTTVYGSVVRDTIVGAYSKLENVVLHRSLIGNDTSLRGLSQSLSIGDDTEIDFS